MDWDKTFCSCGHFTVLSSLLPKVLHLLTTLCGCLSVPAVLLARACRIARMLLHHIPDSAWLPARTTNANITMQHVPCIRNNVSKIQSARSHWSCRLGMTSDPDDWLHHPCLCTSPSVALQNPLVLAHCVKACVKPLTSLPIAKIGGSRSCPEDILPGLELKAFNVGSPSNCCISKIGVA